MINRLNEVQNDEEIILIEIFAEEIEDVQLTCDENFNFSITTKQKMLKKGINALLDDDQIVLMKAKKLFPNFVANDILEILTDKADSDGMYEDWEDDVFEAIDKKILEVFLYHMNTVMRNHCLYTWDENRDIIFVNNPAIEAAYPQKTIHDTPERLEKVK